MLPAMVWRINESINKIAAMQGVQKMTQYGVEDFGGNEKFDSFIWAEQQKWALVANQAKVRVDASDASTF